MTQNEFNLLMVELLVEVVKEVRRATKSEMPGLQATIERLYFQQVASGTNMIEDKDS